MQQSDFKAARRYLRAAGCSFLLFLLFTLAVSFLDRQPIGPEASTVGLAALNRAALGLFGIDLQWHKLTELLGLLAIGLGLGFALIALLQWIRRKNLWKVDPNLLLLGCLYVVLGLCYVFFELVVVNRRPILMDGALEASYPSSHTVLAVCVFSTAIVQFHRLLPGKRRLCLLLDGVCILLLLLTVAGRLLSGVHWFTDILGGLLLSLSLVFAYLAAEARFRR